MVDHDTGRDTDAIEAQHLLYVASLPPGTRRLISQRMSLGRGSWETLEEKIPRAKSQIEELRTYEAIHGIDLDYYLKRHKESYQESLNPRLSNDSTTDTTS